MSRVLPVMRYSGEDDAGAMDRQRTMLEAWIAETGHSVAGWVDDETVSGSVNLDERKSLGEWLREPKLSQWDTMAVAWQDRITRDDIHWWKFVGKLLDWGKHLVVLDDPSLDLSTPNGRMVAGIKATMAANYRRDVEQKTRDARESFRQQRRYAGGHWPYGYRAEPRQDGDGYRLVVDPVTSVFVREAVDRMLDGSSTRRIAQDWNERGVDTARDHQARTTPVREGEQPKTVKGYSWSAATLKRILVSPHLLGYASHNGEIIREEGLPVQWADPIITPDELTRVSEIIHERGKRIHGVQRNRSPLLGVVYCRCGRLMHFLKNNGYEYYRCKSDRMSTGDRCEHVRNWPVRFIQDALHDLIDMDLAGMEILTRVYIPGENYDDDIAKLRESINHLTGNLANLPAGSRAAESVIQQLQAREAELDRIEALPTSEPSYRYEPTGETFDQKWYALEDWHARGAWLLSAGIRIELGGTREAPWKHYRLPEDVRDRLGV